MKNLDYSYVLKRREAGATYEEIGREYGVTRQCVHQFCKKHSIVKPEEVKALTPYGVRKQAFGLSEDLYSVASIRFSRKKQNSKYKNLEFTVKFEDIFWPSHCPILGIELDYEGLSGKKQENSVSFDRIDSSKGYIPGNVQILSWRANRIKNDGTAEEHRQIYEYMISKTL